MNDVDLMTPEAAPPLQVGAGEGDAGTGITLCEPCHVELHTRARTC